jgi:nucleoside-diphosphate-sugar epimerase
MRILIIGGTRFIGPAVVHRLNAQSHDITLFHRGKSKAALPDGIMHIYGDRKKLLDFQNDFKKFRPDVVLDMIPITEKDASAVVKTFRGIAKRLVAISSQDVYRSYGILIGKEEGLESVPTDEDAALRTKLYPYRSETPRSDDDPRKILDDYDKIPIEKIIMDNTESSGTILRLPMVYGPGDYQHRLFEYLKRMDDKRPAIILEQGLAAWRSSVGYVENVADAIALAIIDERAQNRIYNVAEPETPTLAEWVKKIGKVAGWHGDLVIAPRDKLPQSMQPDFTTEQHLTVDTTRIREELGYRESIPQDEALRRTIEWERKHPPDNISPEQFDYETEDKVLNSLGFIDKK